MLILIFTYAVLILLSGIISISLNKRPVSGKYFAALINSLLSIILLIFIIAAWGSYSKEIFIASWPLPFAEFNIGSDYLTLFFMIPLLLLTAGCSLYGSQYYKDKKAKPLHWFSYALLVSGMVMVLISRNVVLFMISWEVMSFASFLLVISDAEKETVRRAGWIYFITAHAGTAFLLTTFFLLSSPSGSFDFELFREMSFSAEKSNLIFIFALAGFGLKAGFIPFHIWLPLAHPAAPSHVSALMSGIMIKMGVYGIIRVLIFLSPFQGWWSIALIIIGAVTGILAVLFAMGQHDIKSLLAYSSVENIGIIFLGLGLGIAGEVYNYPGVSMFGFAGALLHIFNHAVFKSLLFMGAGSVIRQTGTGKIDQLGGLLKKLPWTGSLFLIASISISGLPFFNGFVSELFIYISSIIGAVKSGDPVLTLISVTVLMSLALIGGLSSACFTKVFGLVFQGHPRKIDISTSKEVPNLMKGSMLFISLFTVLIGMSGFAILTYLWKPILLIAGESAAPCFDDLHDITFNLSIFLASALLLLIIFIILKMKIINKVIVKVKDTWGCGYTQPSTRMQYTSSSYTDPITDCFKLILALKKDRKIDKKLFPENNWSVSSDVEDWFLSRIYIFIIKKIDALFSLLRWFQCGKAGVYVLYVAFAVVMLIIWKFIIC